MKQVPMARLESRGGGGRNRYQNGRQTTMFMFSRLQSIILSVHVQHYVVMHSMCEAMSLSVYPPILPRDERRQDDRQQYSIRTAVACAVSSAVSIPQRENNIRSRHAYNYKDCRTAQVKIAKREERVSRSCCDTSTCIALALEF